MLDSDARGSDMRAEGSSSWMMRESHGHGLQVALYIRDTEGLDYSMVPPLDPPVARVSDEPPTEDDRHAWRAWFGCLLAAEASDELEDPFVLLLATGPTRRLGIAAAERFNAAEAWCEARAVDYRSNFFGQTHDQRLAVNRLVTEVEWELDRRAAPFTLNLTVLAVAGAWSHRARHDLLLLSMETRYDETQLRAVLIPVLRELA